MISVDLNHRRCPEKGLYFSYTRRTVIPAARAAQFSPALRYMMGYAANAPAQR